jgi:hypothetical protein
MNWNSFLTYGESPQNAFEILCNQIFERYLNRKYTNDLFKFRVINGSGGDGGIEAYGQLSSGGILAVQTKWFRDVLEDAEIGQIRRSVNTAMDLRPNIKEYTICIPHDVTSLKYGRGKKGENKKPINNFEEKRIDDFTNEIKAKYPDLTLIWWYEKEIELELQQSNNEGVHKFWFDKEIISLDYLTKQFDLQKRGWLHERYIPELHAQGIINYEYQKVCYSFKYRKELSNSLERVSNDLHFCIDQIERFISVNNILNDLNNDLEVIKGNLVCFLKEFQSLNSAIIIGNDYYKPQAISEIRIWDTKLKLEKLKPTNLQKNILPKLVSTFESIHQLDLPKFLEHLGLCSSQKIRLILGDPGTGKTHGLANCVENHLNHNSPAVIIQALGCPCKNWTQILASALELNNWRKEEILSALESLAVKNDFQSSYLLGPDKESNSECTKAIICIDGLEEDIENQKDWYSRIRECEQFVENYPKVRFIFSARRYFYNNKEIPKQNVFQKVSLPREGDVSILDVAEKYFSKEHFNIQISSYSLIKGIDSLFALRLFCEQYKNSTISDTDKIVTAARDLLNIKIERINREFLTTLQNRIGKTRNPVLDSLRIIADHFYINVEVEHNQLVELISPTVKDYLNNSEIDSLIDYLSNNAFLIKSERVEKVAVLSMKKCIYFVTYQSIIEHIISEKIYLEIKNESLNRIPNILLHGMVQPLDLTLNIQPRNFEIPTNRRIIQIIINNIFYEKSRLIGEKNFLTEGFSPLEIFKMQMEALRKAPLGLAIKYKKYIDELFFIGYRERLFIIRHLIMPSCNSNSNIFGAEYLHELLFKQPSLFERDRLWSGLDDYERNLGNKVVVQQKYTFIKKIYHLLQTLIHRNGGSNLNEKSPFDLTFLKEPDFDFLDTESLINADEIHLTTSSLHNEYPLIYAWGLSTIDQHLRNRLRVELVSWAIKNTTEFILLLDKLFNCNDPQIQEDFASIMLGVASRVKEKEKIKALALWSVNNIFSFQETHRNIIVRQGFRSIVERAFQFGIISENEVSICRPRPIKKITILPFELNEISIQQGECYPIVYDLAWYVIERAYDDFLEAPSVFGDDTIDNDCDEAKALLNEYRIKFKEKDLYGFKWAMIAAISFIKNHGFNRTTGNWHTDATHGSKSIIFTYEEKYTWLAVHYIQGYLSDYVPIRRWSNSREFVKDYSQLSDIPNPSDLMLEYDSIGEDHNFNYGWVIKEVLSSELDTESDVKKSISDSVNEDPNLNFENWLSFKSSDFQLSGQDLKWTALYNRTTLHDSKQLCHASIDAKACLIEKNDLKTLKEIIIQNPDELRFITYLNNLHSSPQTDTYCNPSDIVWMTWIEEDETGQSFYKKQTDEEKIIHHTLTQAVKNTFDKESHIMLPSKKVRELIGCFELIGGELKNGNGNTLAFCSKISDGFYRDSQELVLVENEALNEALYKEGYEIIWFIEHFKSKNPLNENLDKNFHVQKSRKYFVWIENHQINSIKFWDEWFSNQRKRE